MVNTQRRPRQIWEKLTDNMELNDLLGVEVTNADSTDVGSLVINLQIVQSQRDVPLTGNLSSVHAGASPLSFN